MERYVKQTRMEQKKVTINKKNNFTFLVFVELRSIVYEPRYKKNGKREISKGGVCRFTEYLTRDNGAVSQKWHFSHKKPQNWIKKISITNFK